MLDLIEHRDLLNPTDVYCFSCKNIYDHKSCYVNKCKVPGFDYPINWNHPDQIPLMSSLATKCFCGAEFKRNNSIISNCKKELNEEQYKLFFKQVKVYGRGGNSFFVRKCLNRHLSISIPSSFKYKAVVTDIKYSVIIPNSRFPCVEHIYASNAREAFEKVLNELISDKPNNITCYFPTEENPWIARRLSEINLSIDYDNNPIAMSLTSINQIGDIITSLKFKHNLKFGFKNSF